MTEKYMDADKDEIVLTKKLLSIKVPTTIVSNPPWEAEYGIPVTLTVQVPTTITENLDVDGNTSVAGTLQAGDTTVNGDANIAGNLLVGGNATWASSIVGITKSFDIPHPTKENMRLRYGCLEGPEYAVYLRGKTYNRFITFPEYWIGLVDADTITVQLTPTQPGQHLYVNSVTSHTIEVLGNDYHEYYYLVLAERKDVPKLEVERNA
jgi:hypothetical protein